MPWGACEPPGRCSCPSKLFESYRAENPHQTPNERFLVVAGLERLKESSVAPSEVQTSADVQPQSTHTQSAIAHCSGARGPSGYRGVVRSNKMMRRAAVALLCTGAAALVAPPARPARATALAASATAEVPVKTFDGGDAGTKTLSLKVTKGEKDMYVVHRKYDLGVPSCRGAFTPSMRLVSSRRGRGWFLFRF